MIESNKISAIKVIMLLIVSFLLLNSNTIFSQDAKKEKTTMPSHDMKGMKDMKDMKHETLSVLDSTVIRKGVIDLKAIDKNKDGKVYQDQMDWNVISDKPGKCPLCKMKLKEVTLEEAKKNLEENDFKVK
ncbi:MAG: heavy metal-binding domain-containing protein [Melioribacteraceae bacterium]